ncbi:C40 family peptidase [Micromonospora sp. NBC_01699]|uniref:C40 family peptidase n=1 Tax=Micromonospora sp. NBC_01699 TaxID=2975984 RepID=UPI002E2E0794|nr:C40 family peptidase [Micromonospora sp. NBC_01699]
MRPTLIRNPWPGVQSLAKLMFALVLIGGALFGVSSLASAASKSCTSGSPGERAVCRAEQQIGDRYVWGAEGPSSFDCSGLVYYAYKGTGASLARTTAEVQSHKGKTVSVKNLQKGDLLYFDWNNDGNVDHVGIYAGKGKMVHASSGSGKVKKVTLSAYYKNHLDTAKRLTPTKPPKADPKKSSSGESPKPKAKSQPTPTPTPVAVEINNVYP